MTQGARKTNFWVCQVFLTYEYFYFKQLIFDWWNKHFISDDDSKILNSVLYHKQCYIVLGSLQNMEFL